MTLSALLIEQENLLRAKVSVEAVHPILFSGKNFQLMPDQYLHHSPFCTAQKSNIATRKSCIQNKARSIKIAEYGRPFCGRCVFGVWEYAMPVFFGGKLVAILYYGCADGKIAGAKEKERIRTEANFAKEFIIHELRMISPKDFLNAKQQSPEIYWQQVNAYIGIHYADDISLGDAAEFVGLHPNYLTTLLKKKSGLSFRKLLNQRRIRESFILLSCHLQLSIAQVAARCGFKDSNYFATVFRHETGETPSAYRKRASTSSSGK